MVTRRIEITGPDDQTDRSLKEKIQNARFLFLGETNHFVREKTDFRLWWLQQLSGDRPLIVGEELSWTDGRFVQAYLRDGDPGHLANAATFGSKAHLRQDRNDILTGVFGGNDESYPHEKMLNAHKTFYDRLRALNIHCYFGFDMDAVGGAYAQLAETQRTSRTTDLPNQFWSDIARQDGETRAEEIARLQAVRQQYQGTKGFETVEEDLLALIESLEYFEMINGATDYAAVAPAMAFREQTMKRRVDHILAKAPDDALIVLMAHAYHLARDDHGIHSEGIVPGGGEVPSLGHYLVNERGYQAASVWMVYGGGQDCQPLPDLPQVADFADDTLNAALGRDAAGQCRVYSTEGLGQPGEPTKLGHMYNLVDRVDLIQQADAILFFPTISPL